MTDTTASAGDLDDLSGSIDQFCTRELPSPTRPAPGGVRDAAAARAQWRALSDGLGLAGLLVPEAQGGAGATLVEAGRVAEVLSARLVTAPFLPSGVLAPVLLSALAPADESGSAAALLERLATGESVATVAWAGADELGSPAPESLSGTIRREYVIDADVADVLLLVGDSGRQVLLVPAEQARITTRPAFDLTRSLSTVEADGADGTVLADGDVAEQAVAAMLTAAELVLAAEAAGGARASASQAVDYARDRYQFGRAIGSYQAIKHLLADAHVAAESALSVARAALAAEVAGDSDARQLRAVAAFLPAQRFNEIARASIQVHGGIGFTVECDAHLYRRKAEADLQLLGTPQSKRERYLTTIEQEQ